MRYYNTIFILFFLTGHFRAGFAQGDTLVFHPVNNPALQHYDVRQITAGRDGKIWLSTGNGLLSYDGNDVKVFLPKENDTTTLSGHSLSRTFMDKHGNLYVVIIADGQIDYFNTRTGKVKRFKLKIAREDSSGYNLAYPFLDIYIENDSSIWGGRTNMGFIHFNPVSKKLSSFSLISESNPRRNTVNGIYSDFANPDLLWLSTDFGIFSFNKKTKQLQRNFRSGNPNDSTTFDPDIRGLHVKNKDTIWFVSHLRGIGCYEIKTGKYTIFPSRLKNSKEEEILFIHFFQYAGSDRYLVSFVERSPAFFDSRTRQYSFNSTVAQELPAISSNQTIVDSLGNIWGNFYGQIYIARQFKNKLTSVSIHDKHYKDKYSNIFKTVKWDEKRKCYYVAFHLSDGVFVFDQAMKPLKTILGPPFNNPPVGLIESVVIDIGLDKNDRLWMCGNIITIYDSLTHKMIPASSVHSGLESLNQRFRNLVFAGNYIFAMPCNPLSRYLYRINVDGFTCDSILLSEVPLAEKQQPNQLGPLEMDSKSENVYISNKNTVFQYNMLTKRTRKIIEIKDLDKAYAHFSNFHWYNVDDNDNLWVSSLSKSWIFEPKGLTVIKVINRKEHTYFNQVHNIKGRAIMCFANSTSYDLYDYKTWKEYKVSINDGLISYLNWSTASANNLLFIGANNYFQHIPLSAITGSKKERKCFLSQIQLFNRPFVTDTLPEYNRSLSLPHNKNDISFTFSSTEFEQPELLEYRYKLDGVNDDWIYVNYLNRTISYTNLRPGNYVFHASVKNDDGSWSNDDIDLSVSIVPAWWQTNLFKIVSFIMAAFAAFALIRWRIKTVRRQEQQKSRVEKEMLELEAKALRAQMNPHFIFNCLNSIKSLIQQHEEEKAVTYLTTFSKLIRTLFNNADRKEISLHDEIETCKLYLQLESMRFDTRFSYSVNIDKNLDLKSILIPALIIQPFIENAIWHGIVPRSSGGNVGLTVLQNNGIVEIVIEDDGIGRETSGLNRSASRLTHQSKGINLTQSRLELDNLLQQRQASLQTIDKKDAFGKATGTKVIIAINEEV